VLSDLRMLAAVGKFNLTCQGVFAVLVPQAMHDSGLCVDAYLHLPAMSGFCPQWHAHLHRPMLQAGHLPVSSSGSSPKKGMCFLHNLALQHLCWQSARRTCPRYLTTLVIHADLQVRVRGSGPVEGFRRLAVAYLWPTWLQYHVGQKVQKRYWAHLPTALCALALTGP